MDAIRRLTTILLVLFAAYCVLAWGVWYSEPLQEIFPTLPLRAEHYPGDNPMIAPLAVSLLTFIVAYFVYPGAEDDD